MHKRPDGVDWIPGQMDVGEVSPFVQLGKLHVADEKKDGDEPGRNARALVLIPSLACTAQRLASRQGESDFFVFRHWSATAIAEEYFAVIG